MSTPQDGSIYLNVPFDISTDPMSIVDLGPVSVNSMDLLFRADSLFPRYQIDDVHKWTGLQQM